MCDKYNPTKLIQYFNISILKPVHLTPQNRASARCAVLCVPLLSSEILTCCWQLELDIQVLDFRTHGNSKSISDSWSFGLNDQWISDQWSHHWISAPSECGTRKFSLQRIMTSRVFWSTIKQNCMWIIYQHVSSHYVMEVCELVATAHYCYEVMWYPVLVCVSR